MIALICDEKQQAWLVPLLAELGEIKQFEDGSAFAEYLQQGGNCQLAVVAKDGAHGMNDSSYAKNNKSPAPILWITEQEEFRKHSKRIGVTGFLVKPVSDDILQATIKQLLYTRHDSRRPQWREI